MAGYSRVRPVGQWVAETASHTFVDANGVTQNGKIAASELNKLDTAVYELKNLFPNVRDYGATPSVLTDQHAYFAAAIAAANYPTAPSNGFVLIPPEGWVNTAVTLPIRGKIQADGAVMYPFGNNQTVLVLTSSDSLQDGDYQLVRGLLISCAATGKTGITGIAYSDSHGSASTILDTVYVLGGNAAVTVDLGGAQFFRSYSCRITQGTGVGMRIAADASTGGGNSHSHYGLHIVGKEVGLFVNGTLFATGCGDLNFDGAQFLENSVCAAAFFNAFGVTFRGGAAEFNGTGAATKTVDGLVVKRCSQYLNNSHVTYDGGFVAEASAGPCYIAENHSVLTLRNANGYGNTNNTLVQCDATSGVNLEGTFGCLAVVENVLSWPDTWILPTGARSVLFGQPVLSKDPTLPVIFSAQAHAWTSSAGTAPSSNAFAESSLMGYCRRVQYQASVGTVSANHVTLSPASVAASQDSVFSMHLVADRDCLMYFTTNIVTTDDINGYAYCKAGKVTRLVFGKRNLPAGTFQLYLFPLDTTGPLVDIAFFQGYQGPTGTQTTTQEIAKIIKLGAFNDGIIRDTAANLALIAATVNSKAKYPGKQVWDTTNNRVVFAAGQASNSVWKDGVNTTVYTPV